MREVKCPECGEFTPLKDPEVVIHKKRSGLLNPVHPTKVRAAFCWSCGWGGRGHLNGDTFVLEDT